MGRATVVITVMGVLAGLAAGAADRAVAKPPAARGGAEKADERREDEAVRKSQDGLQDAQKALREAEKAAREADLDHRDANAAREAAAVALQKTTDRLEAKHAGPSGLAAARSRWKELQESTDSTAENVAELKREAKARIDVAQAACEKAVANDPESKSAREAFEQARTAELQALQRRDRTAGAFAAAQAKVARAQQSLAAKKAADARDANKPEGKNKGRKQ